MRQQTRCRDVRVVFEGGESVRSNIESYSASALRKAYVEKNAPGGKKTTTQKRIVSPNNTKSNNEEIEGRDVPFFTFILLRLVKAE